MVKKEVKAIATTATIVVVVVVVAEGRMEGIIAIAFMAACLDFSSSLVRLNTYSLEGLLDPFLIGKDEEIKVLAVIVAVTAPKGSFAHKAVAAISEEEPSSQEGKMFQEVYFY